MVYNACVMSYITCGFLKLYACYDATIMQYLTVPMLLGMLSINLCFPLPLDQIVAPLAPLSPIKTRYGQYVALGTILAHIFLAYPLASYTILHGQWWVSQIVTIAMVSMSLWLAAPMVLTV